MNSSDRLREEANATFSYGRYGPRYSHSNPQRELMFLTAELGDVVREIVRFGEALIAREYEVGSQTVADLVKHARDALTNLDDAWGQE